MTIPTEKHVTYDWAGHLGVLSQCYQIVSLFSIWRWLRNDTLAPILNIPGLGLQQGPALTVQYRI